MLIVSAIRALSDNYIWVIAKNEYCIIIDPASAAPIFDFLKDNNMRIAAILVTHHHYDHTGGLKLLYEKFKPPIYGPTNIKYISNQLNGGEQLKILGINFQVIATPGHTLDHICYYANDSLFCGDTLFLGGCGRLFEGTANQLYQSLQNLSQLPENTKLFCAHEYSLRNLKFASTIEPNNTEIKKRISTIQQQLKKGLLNIRTTIALEKATNPFLRCDHPDVIASVSKYCGKILQKQQDIFTQLRIWKDKT